MQIEHINEEFPYTIVRELYTEEQKERIWKELDEHQSNLQRVENDRNRCWCRILDNISEVQGFRDWQFEASDIKFEMPLRKFSNETWCREMHKIYLIVLTYSYRN